MKKVKFFHLFSSDIEEREKRSNLYAVVQNPIREVGTIIISVLLIFTASFSFCIHEVECAYLIILAIITYWIK